MLRRLLVWGLLLFVCPLAPGALLAGPPLLGRRVAAPLNVKVLYRARKTAGWQLFGIFTPASGRNVARLLTQQHFEVRLERTAAPVPQPPPRPPSPPLPPAQTVSPAQVVAVFRHLAARPDIAFRRPEDGCYARAHLMVKQMLAWGLHPIKVWAFASGDELQVRTPHHPSGHVTWVYHVAPALRVRFPDGSQHWYVIDPSLFDGPVPIANWEGAQVRSPDGYHPFLCLTLPAEAPVRPFTGRTQGSGYWPAADPPEGPDAHAAAVMRRMRGVR
jgi:hypothetical protein